MSKEIDDWTGHNNVVWPSQHNGLTDGLVTNMSEYGEPLPAPLDAQDSPGTIAVKHAVENPKV